MNRHRGDLPLTISPGDWKGLAAWILGALATYLWTSNADSARKDAVMGTLQASRDEAIHARDRELDNLHAEVRDLQRGCRR